MISTTWYPAELCSSQELLMVRHQLQAPQFQPDFTRKLDIFKADLDAGRLVPVIGGNGSNALAQGEAFFLSRSSSKAIQVYGEGSIYSPEINKVFDTTSWVSMPFRLPWQRRRVDEKWPTWIFPPKLVV
ncbi:hypothetical protein BS78_07G006800 [Paspalum vaginatum]|nr:hypothetical protein BS78_07G006800 [Paspalum vaginatum]